MVIPLPLMTIRSQPPKRQVVGGRFIDYRKH
nr:MAG TPA: hypothetical protein [Herelleviridae sp.]